jgi:type I restriction enzyme S subunit
MQTDCSKSLKEITSKIGSGATPSGGNNTYKLSGISLIRSQNILDFKFSFDGLAFIDETQAKALNNVEVHENDILLNITGDSIARVCIVPNEVLPARLNQHVSIIRCKDKEEAEYVLCYLQFLKKHLLSICKVGGTRNALTKDAIEKIRINIIPNHKLLGKYISQINAKIELNNRINRELEAMAKTLYDYWFVQFDFPNEQGKPYKSSGGKMVYNAELKREIPDGWDVKKLSEICSFISRGISPVYINEGGICVLNQKCVRNRTILYGEARRNDNNIRNAKTKRILKYDVLVNSTGVGTLGRVAVVNRLAEDFVTVDSHVTIIRANTELINKFYFGFSLLEKQNEIEGFSNGSTGQVELNRSQLETLKVIVPSNEIQIKFEKSYKNNLEKMAVNAVQNQQLTELRDWLLPMLMNGQVVSTSSTTATVSTFRLPVPELVEGMAEEPSGE